MRSKIYTGSVIGRILDVLAFKGYMVFLPKFLENHFGIPQYLVHRYMGESSFVRLMHPPNLAPSVNIVTCSDKRETHATSDFAIEGILQRPSASLGLPLAPWLVA